MSTSDIGPLPNVPSTWSARFGAIEDARTTLLDGFTACFSTADLLALKFVSPL